MVDEVTKTDLTEARARSAKRQRDVHVKARAKHVVESKGMADPEKLITVAAQISHRIIDEVSRYGIVDVDFGDGDDVKRRKAIVQNGKDLIALYNQLLDMADRIIARSKSTSKQAKATVSLLAEARKKLSQL